MVEKSSYRKFDDFLWNRLTSHFKHIVWRGFHVIHATCKFRIDKPNNLIAVYNMKSLARCKNLITFLAAS